MLRTFVGYFAVSCDGCLTIKLHYEFSKECGCNAAPGELLAGFRRDRRVCGVSQLALEIKCWVQVISPGQV